MSKLLLILYNLSKNIRQAIKFANIILYFFNSRYLLKLKKMKFNNTIIIINQLIKLKM